MAKHMEISTYGMGAETDEGQTLAEHRDDVVSWDVMLTLRDDDTGEIEVLEELNDLTDEAALAYAVDLARRYPDACIDDATPY